MTDVNFYLLNALASTNPNVDSTLKTLLKKAAQKTTNNKTEEAKQIILQNKTFVKELIDMLKLPASQRSTFTENTLKALSKNAKTKQQH